MKKTHLLIIIFFSVLLTYTFTLKAYASEQTILFNGDLWDVTDKCILNEGVTYIELKTCLDKFAYIYRIEGSKIYLENKDNLLLFNIGYKDYEDNGKQKIMSNAIIENEGIIYIPLRFFSERNNYEVRWSRETHSIEISSKELVPNPLESETLEVGLQENEAAMEDNGSSLNNETETVNVKEDLTIGDSITNSVITVTPKHFVELSGTYFLETMEQDLKFVSEYYSDMTQLEVIGRTYEGRPIYAIKIGNQSTDDKPCILLMSNIHAREDFSSMLTMKMLDSILYSYYDKGYFGHYNVKELLSKIDIWFIPVANPDGLNITQQGIVASNNYSELLTMDNIANDHRWWKSNANGVDLNRNFDDGNWAIKESTPSKSSEGYKGLYPNSEPETRAIQAFCNEKLPLMSISYHSSGDTMFWADSNTHDYFEGVDEEIVKRMSDLTGYSMMPISKDPSIYGSGFENWFRAKFNRLSICMELSPYPDEPFIQHDDNEFDVLVWSKAKYTGLQLATEAIAYQDKMYEVFQLSNYVKTFYSFEKAKNYGQYFLDSYIINKGTILQ